MNQLVVDIQEAFEHSETVSRELKEVFVCLAVFAVTAPRNKVVQFAQTNILEALLQEQNLHKPILLLVHRQARKIFASKLGSICKEKT